MPLPCCVSCTSTLSPEINNITEGTRKTDAGENLSKISTFLTLNGPAWVLVLKVLLEIVPSSGQSPILRVIIINALLFPFTPRGQKMLLVYEFIPPCITIGGSAGQRAEGLCSPPIYYSCQLGRDFFFFFYLVKGPSAMNQ